jgi:hypothetical protein
MNSLRVWPAAFSTLLLVVAAISCRDPASPDYPAPEVSGAYVLLRAGGFPVPGRCFRELDRQLGEVSVSLGLLLLDAERSLAQQEEVWLGCTRGDTLSRNEERPFHISGPLIIVDRAVAIAEPADTGTTIGNTLILRRAGADFVYERVAALNDYHYYRTSDVAQWSVGLAVFWPEPSNGGWTLNLSSRDFQEVYLLMPPGVRPSVGTFSIGSKSAAPYFALMRRTLKAQEFEATSGMLTVTESTEGRLVGSFRIDLRGSSFASMGLSTRVEGRFVARCGVPGRTPCGD